MWRRDKKRRVYGDQRHQVFHGGCRICQQLGIVQPALTRHIKQLEDEFGVSLLNRLPRGVQLTAAGREFLEHCRRIMEEVSLARHELTSQGAIPKGSLVFGASPTLGRVLMPEIVGQSMMEFPGISLRVVEARSSQLQDLLLTGELDMAVLTNPVGSHRLSLHPLVSEPLGVVGKRGWRARKGVVELKELAEIPLILTPGMRFLASGGLGGHKVRLQVAAEIESIETIRSLVMKGSGVTVVPASAFMDDLSSKALQFYPINAPDRQRNLVLASRTDNAEDPAVRELSRIVRRAVGQKIGNGDQLIRS
jgi:LysR family transcriptional regulator, nitrogen assimilation regulatory protein